ncbi:MAG: c-type cytochrome, partial [Planctomycetaceae bacterium]
QKHNHSHNHFWEYPMLPERLRDAACIKCHHDVIELGVNPEFGATAPEAYRGWQLIRKYGCFGCHEINGYDGQDRIGPDLRLEPTAEEADRYASDPNLIPGQMRKVGPSLKRIADKTTADWIAYWTEKPKRFRATTKMPQFFGLTNLQDHLGEQLSSLELRALGAFLIKQSSTDPANGQGLMSPPEGYKPDAERGVKMFSEKGCLACHSHDGEEFKGATATFGPNLTNVGRKLRAGESGFNWLYTWIRDPERHHPRTKMPNLFLEPVRNKAGELISDPAADIAAFLIGRGGYDLTPLDADEARTELAARLVQTGKLSQAQFDEFLKSHDYTQPASWPETLLTTTEAGELNWADVVSRYIDATGYRTLLSEHLVAGGLLTAEEFDGFLSSRTYPERSGESESAPVVWPETLLQQDTDSDARWAAVQQEYLLAKATLELSRLYLSGKVLTSDQFATLWGINWQGERKYTQLIARLREEQAGSEDKDQDVELKLQIKDAQANLDAIQNGRGKLPLTRDQVKGDEIELYTDGDAVPTEEKFREKMLNFLGRRSVARYGCYGCHDINGFGSARSIGTALQDWGRKDPSRLAPEHIHEYLHHHGRRDGSSQQQYVEKSLARATDDSFDTEAERDSALRTAFFYDSLIHHGRPGFIFQKLRQPRSYDYKKTDTKGYTERLVMPMFPLQDDEIEAISTFVLGLVAEPPAPKYIYSPDQRTKDRNHGEILLQKYNCGGCHVLEMPELEFAYTEESQFAASELSGTDLAAGRDALLRVRPPVQGYFGKFHSLKREDEPAESLPVVRLRGLVKAPDPNDPEYDPEDPDPYILTAWEPVRTRGALAAKNQARMDEVEALFDRTASSLAGADLTGKVTEVLTTLTEESSTDWLGALDRSSLRGVAAGTVGRLSLFFESAGDTGPLAVPQAELVQIAAVFEALADGQTGEIESLGTTAAELATGLADFLVPGPMGDTLLPSKPVFATGPELVNYQKARGGAFAEWLVKYQVDSKLAKDPNFAWQASPPPLFREGEKVQTDWLYRFLKNPTQIRYTTLLRMPRFNLSDSEAQALTNYFAAVDGSTYPYEKQPQQRASYLAAKQAQFQTEFPERAAVSNYDDESWRMLTSTLCIQCHAVGNDLPKGDPDKPGELIRGPNLNRVHERLRPDWVSVWLFNPAWVTSYTSMPAPFGAHVSGPKNPYLPLFNGDSLDQTNGVRDALMNYPAFLERGYKPLPLIAKPVPDTGTGQ